MRMRRFLAAAVVAVAALAPIGAAEANFGVRIGVLTCDVAGGAGFILGSQKAVACTFNGIKIRHEPYVGAITKIGLDAGATGGAKIVWAVFAPASNVGPTALEGRYYGVSAEVTPAVGIGANVLIGGFDRSIILQPLSVSGQLGANIAAGIGYLRLKSPPEPVYKR